MSVLDGLTVQHFRQSLQLYKRYIDDILIVCNRNVINELIAFVNSWDTGIKITHDSSEGGTRTNFLDLLLTIGASGISYSTYRKPQNSYAYLPYFSCHTRAAKHAIISTECVRMLLTNDSESHFHDQIRFFTRKLIARGYPGAVIRNITSKYSWSAKAEVLAKRTQPRKAKVALVFQHTAGMAALGVGGILRRHLPLLAEEVRENISLVAGHSSAPNLFRYRYARFVVPPDQFIPRCVV